MKKVDPKQVVELALTGIEENREEVLADEFTEQVKRSLGNEQPMYLMPPEIS